MSISSTCSYCLLTTDKLYMSFHTHMWFNCSAASMPISIVTDISLYLSYKIRRLMWKIWSCVSYIVCLYPHKLAFAIKRIYKCSNYNRFKKALVAWMSHIVIVQHFRGFFSDCYSLMFSALSLINIQQKYLFYGLFIRPYPISVHLHKIFSPTFDSAFYKK